MSAPDRPRYGRSEGSRFCSYRLPFAKGFAAGCGYQDVSRTAAGSTAAIVEVLYVLFGQSGASTQVLLFDQRRMSIIFQVTLAVWS